MFTTSYDMYPRYVKCAQDINTLYPRYQAVYPRYIVLPKTWSMYPRHVDVPKTCSMCPRYQYPVPTISSRVPTISCVTQDMVDVPKTCGCTQDMVNIPKTYMFVDISWIHVLGNIFDVVGYILRNVPKTWSMYPRHGNVPKTWLTSWVHLSLYPRRLPKTW